MSEPTDFGELLRSYRKRASLTQAEFSEKAGISASYVALLETGRKKTPSRGLVKDMAEALHLSGQEREEFFAAAGYASRPGAAAPAKVTHPLYRAVTKLLAAERGSDQLSRAIRAMVRELVLAVSYRKGSGEDNAMLRGAGLAGLGYFHKASDKDVESAGRGPRRATRKEIKLANELCSLMQVLADGSVPIDRRIKLVEELLSFARWSTSDSDSQRTPKKSPKK